MSLAITRVVLMLIFLPLAPLFAQDAEKPAATVPR
jgi:hypothetical protein